MRGEDASVRRRTGEWEGVYESSVPVCRCGEGESRRKDSFPGQVVDGTEDSAKCIAPSAGFRG